MSESSEIVQIRFEEMDDILLATCTGSYNAESDEYIDRTVAAECKSRQKLKVIVDYTQLHVASHHSTIESYQGATSLLSRGFTLQVAIAYVDRPEYQPDNDMFRLVARNRGINLRHFYTIDEAIDWLRNNVA